VQFRSIYVNELIDQTTKTWKEQLVHYLFDLHTTCLILNTPLFPQFIINALVWIGEKNGKYSICRAYRICIENT